MFVRLFTRNMSRKIALKVINNAEIAEKRLAELRNKLEEVKKIKIEEKVRELTQENSILANKVENAKKELIALEIQHGKKQYSVPGKTSIFTHHSTAPIEPVNNEDAVQDSEQPTNKKEKKDKDGAKKKEKQPNAPTNDVDVRKLDFRIGKIIEINKHPDADSLYVEQIDCGEARPRTVVSGLVNHVPIEEMRDRIVVVLCNLKPVKMRGIMSEAMVMCASSPEKVEVLTPPSGAIPGDLVECNGYPREPEALLNPKKKIFETCAPDLKTNDDKIACYKDSPLVVPGKGPIVAPSLKAVSVK